MSRTLLQKLVRGSNHPGRHLVADITDVVSCTSSNKSTTGTQQQRTRV